MSSLPHSDLCVEYARGRSRPDEIVTFRDLEAWLQNLREYMIALGIEPGTIDGLELRVLSDPEGNEIRPLAEVVACPSTGTLTFTPGEASR